MARTNREVEDVSEALVAGHLNRKDDTACLQRRSACQKGVSGTIRQLLMDHHKWAMAFHHACTVGSHDSDSQDFKLRVSDPGAIASLHFKTPSSSPDTLGAGPAFPG